MATLPDEARLDDQPPGREPPGDESPGEGSAAEASRRDWRARLRLPWLRHPPEEPDPEPVTADQAVPATGETVEVAEPLLPAGASPEPDVVAPALPRRERRRRRAASRRRWLVMVPSILAVLIVVAVIGAQLRSGAPAPARTSSRGAPAPAPPRVPTLLLAHVAGNGQVDLAAVVGVTRNGRDGSILAIPTLTQAETPSLDFQVLADLRSLGSTTLLQTTIENLLGVRIDATEVFDDARLTDVIGAAGPLTVDLNGETEVGGTTTRVFSSGTQRVNPGDAVALLTQRPATDEIDHMVTVQAVFEGWLAALRDQSAASASVAKVPALATLVAAARASTDFSELPVDSISGGPGERYQVREDALGPAIQQEFPEALLGIGGHRLRTEILNGTGVVGLVPQVARVVVPAGAQVVTTGNMPGFGQATTRVVYYRDADRAAAARLLSVLGVGKLVKEPDDIKVFDVTIIAGADFRPPPGG
jgi:LytR cell envelope-related transcriptional attenuator